MKFYAAIRVILNEALRGLCGIKTKTFPNIFDNFKISLEMENGNPPKKKSKKKKIRSNSPQASNGSEKVNKCEIYKLQILTKFVCSKIISAVSQVELFVTSASRLTTQRFNLKFTHA